MNELRLRNAKFKSNIDKNVIKKVSNLDTEVNLKEVSENKGKNGAKVKSQNKL